MYRRDGRVRLVSVWIIQRGISQLMDYSGLCSFSISLLPCQAPVYSTPPCCSQECRKKREAKGQREWRQQWSGPERWAAEHGPAPWERRAGACRNAAPWLVSGPASDHFKNKSKHKSWHPDMGREKAGVTGRMQDLGTWVPIPYTLLS